ARLAARRRTTEDVAGLRAALELRTALGPGAGAAFVDADVALHAAVVAAAHNPVLTDLFEEFAPVLRSGLVELVELLDLRRLEDDHGHDAHAALVEAVAGGDGEAAAQALRVELERTRAHLE
ncbi:MAG: FCD domain-containing protein, partial [Nonomuraea sp.]|nr:FCD domain-containing protein [Nonomuraea sp.]